MAAIATLTLTEILDRLEAHASAALPRMLATGGGTRLRVGLFAIHEDNQLELLVDAFPSDADLATLARTVKPARMGRWDAAESNRWNHAWTVGTPDWQLWSRTAGRLFWLADDALHRAGPQPALPLDAIAVVQTWASPGWYEQGAEVRLEDETTVVLARTTSWAARLDPSYDFDQLTHDLTWAEHLSRDLANVLGVPVGEAIPDRDA